MQTNQKAIVITIAAILVAAFFMPWLKLFFVSASAWDMVFGEAGNAIDTPLKYVSILIPIAGILIIYGAAFNNELYPIPKRFLFILPIVALGIMAIGVGTSLVHQADNMDSSQFNNITKIFGVGLWLTLLGSLILPFLTRQSNQQSK